MQAKKKEKKSHPDKSLAFLTFEKLVFGFTVHLKENLLFQYGETTL